jgi:biopolymer transport protein ExbB
MKLGGEEGLGGLVETLWTSMLGGDLILWLLLILAVAVLGVLAGRFAALREAGAEVDSFLNTLRSSLVVKRSVGEAVRLGEQSKGPVASIVKAGLLKYGQPREDVQWAVANATLTERGRLQRGLPLLAAGAKVAPLLGALDTLLKLSGSQIVAVETLAPAAAGLAVAIPAHLGLIYFRSRIDRFERQVATAGNVLLETLTEMDRGGAPLGAR